MILTGNEFLGIGNKMLTMHNFLSSERYWTRNLVFNSFLKIDLRKTFFSFQSEFISISWLSYYLLFYLYKRLVQLCFFSGFIKSHLIFAEVNCYNCFSFDRIVLRCFNYERFINRKNEMV